MRWCNSSMKNEDKRFPDCFPPNFKSEILPKDAREESKIVYRVMKEGQINRDAFLSTCEEVLRGKRPPSPKDNSDDPGYYSTSCCLNPGELKYFLKLSMKREPTAFIPKGRTAPECGLCQQTSERLPNFQNQSHIDWWVYQNSNPQDYFFKEGECDGQCLF